MGLDPQRGSWGPAGMPMYDNDSEFSKLYIARDRLNTARGMFIIDLKELLKNNSFYFNLIKDETVQDAIALGTKIIELKIYRDRIKKNTFGRTYEVF